MRFIKSFLTLIIFVAFSISAITQTSILAEPSFKSQFDLARNYLLESRTQRAIPILEKLAKEYPKNANISYLLGICLTESDDLTDMSIYYLEKAKPKVTNKYAPNSHLETRAPIFLYYFLVVAYSQNRLCREAYTSFKEFRSFYGEQKRDFYISDALRWVEACSTPEEMKTMEVAGEQTMDLEVSQERTIKKEKQVSKKRSYITKKLDYSISSSIYSIQVGATSKVIPVYKFEGLKNINAFMDDKGKIRYVMGRFTNKKGAESLLKVVKEKGYPDAFIVDINKERKYKEELVIYNEVSLKKKREIPHNVFFSVQIGAFRDTIPFDLAVKYTEIDHIRELVQDDITVMASGDFKNYNEATKYKDQLKLLGIPGCFVIALKDGVKTKIENYMLED